ncbi:hypothetical protein ACFSYD_09410 [Paracoccus aerius]
MEGKLRSCRRRLRIVAECEGGRQRLAGFARRIAPAFETIVIVADRDL